MPMPHKQLQDVLDRRKAEIEASVEHALEKVVLEVENAMRDRWPRKNSPYGVHPYASGKSAHAWSARVVSPLKMVVANKTPYADLVDKGYTRKGKGTAKPWLDRGGKPYTRSILSELDLVGMLKEKINV